MNLGKSSKILILLVFLNFLFLIIDARNTCGGENELYGIVGNKCNPETADGCTDGILICHGTDVLMCLPKCKHTINKMKKERKQSFQYKKDINQVNKRQNIDELIESTNNNDNQNLNDQTNDSEQYFNEYINNVNNNNNKCVKEPLFCENKFCGKNSVCSDQLKKCVCFPGYSGENCDNFDKCYNIDCGIHGICNNGKCKCDEGFDGELCKMKTTCQPNGIWLDNKCSCIRGFSGEYCNQCSSDSICVPTKDKKHPYTLIYVTDDLKKEMLENDPPPGYEWLPIKPGSISSLDDKYYDCACNYNNNNDNNVENFDNLRSNFVYFDDYYYQYHQYQQNSHYRDDFHDHYHGGYGGCYSKSYGASILGFIIVLFILCSLFYCLFFSGSDSNCMTILSGENSYVSHKNESQSQLSIKKQNNNSLNYNNINNINNNINHRQTSRGYI